MKKYLLLLTLFCATFAMGTLLFNAAHQNTSIASIADESTFEEGLFSGRAEVKESVSKENEDASSGLVEITKEAIKDGSEVLAKFIFSLIYK